MTHNIKNRMVLAQKQSVDQRKIVEDPNMSAHNFTYLIFCKDTKNIYWREHNLQQMMMGKLGVHIKKNKI